MSQRAFPDRPNVIDRRGRLMMGAFARSHMRAATSDSGNIGLRSALFGVYLLTNQGRDFIGDERDRPSGVYHYGVWQRTDQGGIYLPLPL